MKGNLPIKLKIIPPESFCISLSMKKYFLKDPRADLFINISNTIFPVHRSQLQPIYYFQRLPKNEKVHIIHQPFNVMMFENILAFFYGERIYVKTFQQLEQLLTICQHLEIHLIVQQIQQILLQNNTKYQIEVFSLLQIAYNYNLHEIFKHCFTLLAAEQFEQINYNKFSFLSVDFRLFQIIIRRHHVLKNIDRAISGVQTKVIEEVIEMYCKKHKIEKQIQTRLFEKYCQYTNYLQPEKSNAVFLKSKKGTIQSAQIDSNSFADVSEQNSQVLLKVTLNTPKSKPKKMRKYSDHTEIQKYGLSEAERYKIHVSGKLKKTENIFQENKIKQQADDDIPVPEEIQSPLIRIKKQSKQYSQESANQNYNNFNNSNKQISTFNPPMLSIPFMPNEEEKMSTGPDIFMDKVSQLLGHYQNAYQLHESNILTIKNNIRRSSLVPQENDRRLSASPIESYHKKYALGVDARLTNTQILVDKKIVNK